MNGVNTLVSVIIVNWNSGDLLSRCLKCLQDQTLIPDEVLIVDNASQDGSSDVAASMPGVRLMKSEKNLGFAGGNNLALAQCRSEFVALLNPDAFPEPDWLEKLVAAAHAYPMAAAFGSRQIMSDDPTRVDGLGDVYHISGLAWRRGYGQLLVEIDESSGDIFSPCAGAALYRRDAIESIGRFDEDYFCYVEDVDLGFRLQLMGYSSKMVPAAIVYHVGSATTGGKHSDFAVYHGHRNLVWTFVKDMPGSLLWVLFPLHIVMNFAALSVFTFRGQGQVIFKAKWDAIKGLPHIIRKRKVVQSNRRCSVADIWRILDKRLFIGKLRD
jgi:GT2 family glycosyltransferase